MPAVALPPFRRDPGRAARMEDLRRLARARLKRQARDLAHDHTHAARVWQNAIRIAAGEGEAFCEKLDGDVLEASCWLLDVGLGREAAGEPRGRACAKAAEELLRAAGLDDLVWAVCEAVFCNRAQGRAPRVPEERVLADADALESLGTIGIGRVFLQAAVTGIPLLYDESDPLATTRVPAAGVYVLDAFPELLARVVANMHTNTGRLEATRRGRITEGFWRAFARELG